MSLGKDSIQKRVAKPTEVAAKQKAPATKAAPKKAPVKTTVVSKIAPEVVEKVTGHKEKTGFEKIALGRDLPAHLL